MALELLRLQKIDRGMIARNYLQWRFYVELPSAYPAELVDLLYLGATHHEADVSSSSWLRASVSRRCCSAACCCTASCASYPARTLRSSASPNVCPRAADARAHSRVSRW